MPLHHALFRWVVGMQRPSKAANLRGLEARGEPLASFTIREAVPEDIPALARLHVETWNATYRPLGMKGPGAALREGQWREAFATRDGSWFCFVIARPDGELIGFAKGRRNDHPEYGGELNKIYLLRDYQRLGLGRRLVGLVARRFLEQGVTSMALYSDPRNPSCRFFEALGGERLREPDGSVNYNWHGWRDLHRLAALCPVD